MVKSTNKYELFELGYIDKKPFKIKLCKINLSEAPPDLAGLF